MPVTDPFVIVLGRGRDAAWLELYVQQETTYILTANECDFYILCRYIMNIFSRNGITIFAAFNVVSCKTKFLKIDQLEHIF